VEPEVNPLMDLVLQFKTAYDREKVLKADLSIATGDREAFEQTLYEEMSRLEIQNIKTKYGMFYQRRSLFASIKPEEKEKFFRWLVRTDSKFLIQKTVNAQNLTAWVKESLGEKVEFDPKDKRTKFLNLTFKNRIGVKGGTNP
jgi:hypothetical protein